ncbi:MAG: Glutathione peroxidase [Anaerocolumna sp.]|nr:Glutathione peroxidase [Anaerocolumna sp.]
MSLYDYIVIDNEGKDVHLSEYKDKVLLIINSATACGFTPQYEKLESMYETFKENGLVILDFPCNQFGHQAPGSDEEIATFCESKYGVTYPIFSKIDVNGEDASPLYQYLVKEKGFNGFPNDNPRSTRMHEKLSQENPNYINEPDIKWNFTKFLIDRNGSVVERFEPMEDLDKIEEKIKELL